MTEDQVLEIAKNVFNVQIVEYRKALALAVGEAVEILRAEIEELKNDTQSRKACTCKDKS